MAMRRGVLSLTTRFCLPHEGMTQLEYLSRGSAFLVDPASSSPSRFATAAQAHSVIVVTCQHVACPWLFPTYFADKWDWLQHVSEDFVQHSLQLLEMPTTATTAIAPKVLAELPLRQQVWLHPARDMALLALDGEGSQDQWRSLLQHIELDAFTLRTGSKPVSGDHVIFMGHKQIQAVDQAADGGDRSDDEEAAAAVAGQHPVEIAGRYVGESAQGQVFAWSEEVLEEGMCGGAVVDADGACVGLIEGIVPPYKEEEAGNEEGGACNGDEERARVETARMRKALAEHVAYIPSRQIAEFVEDKSEFMVLTGLALNPDAW